MLTLALPVRVFLCTRHADLRKSFDGLAQLVREFLGCDPLAGHLFVFRNQRGDRLKLLYWDSDGYAIGYQRLEEGIFALPPADATRTPVGDHGVVLRPAELAMLLDGIDLANVKRRKRYQRPAPTAP
jgi:transposase